MFLHNPTCLPTLASALTFPSHFENTEQQSTIMFSLNPWFHRSPFDNFFNFPDLTPLLDYDVGSGESGPTEKEGGERQLTESSGYGQLTRPDSSRLANLWVDQEKDKLVLNFEVPVSWVCMKLVLSPVNLHSKRLMNWLGQGIKKENLRVKLDGDMLRVEGHDSSESKDPKSGTMSKSRLAFHRSIRIPKNQLKEQEFCADYEDGILKVTLPRIEEKDRSDRDRVRQLEIN